MKLQLKNGAAPSEIQLSDAAFGRAYNEALVHQVVTAYMRRRPRGHQGAEVARRSARRRQEALEPEGHGPGARRLHPQPIWVGGGRTFAARPRDFSQKVNRKMYRGAMQLDALGAGAPGSPGRGRRRSSSRAPKTKLLVEQARRTRSLTRALILVEALRGEAVPRGAQHAACGGDARSPRSIRLSLVKHDKVHRRPSAP